MRYVHLTTGQIKALKTFELSDGTVIEADTLGGFIDSPKNLAQNGSCWVFPDGYIGDDAFVSGDVIIRKGKVLDKAQVYGNVRLNGGVIRDKARVLGDVVIQETPVPEEEKKQIPLIAGNAIIFGKILIKGSSMINR